MTRFRSICRALALPMALFVASWSLPWNAAHAELVPTERLVDGAPDAEERRATVQQFIAREDVRAHLRGMGVDPDEAAARVRALSDREVAEIAGHIEREPAGQSIGAVIGAVVLVFIILLVTDILGLTKVFPFTRSVR